MSAKWELSFESVAADASPHKVLEVVEGLLPPGLHVMLSYIPGGGDLTFAIDKLSPSEIKYCSDLAGRDVADEDGEDTEEERSASVHILSSYERTGHTLRVDRQSSQFEVGDVVIAGGDCWRVLRKLTKYRGRGCQLYVDRISNWQVERALRSVNL